MGCNRCGKATSKRLCDQCSLATGDGRQHTGAEDLPECPECGRDTSAKGTTCYRCRRVES